ncbi:phosphoenolpyruvate--protein phosphotransferase [Pedobacter miscanthi]|uniref:Phosphoenolpyruvate-protein phosphotransferase n=1 Tax=Pedobacter miscanthi TaxID=2259170 RepID=A0A366KPR7_9SPHI|nr:phosphoenolpyruvate--protein phosphotransferase [Pedobacter miscanthi]RBQ03104.1 phosphoenolpyruvate--protein phosphotransferase [Pedobacter miscanthi]
MINGVGVSPGITIGRAFVIKKNQGKINGRLLNNEAEILHEIKQFDLAVELATAEIQTIKTDTQTSLNEEESAILETQIELIGDPQIREDVIGKINAQKINASDALLQVLDAVVQLFENMDDEYMRARSSDMKDIANRIFKHLNKTESEVHRFEPNTIIIADDLAPSDTITMDIRYITGFATQTGSKTSHTAIIAKAKGIPAIVNCGQKIYEIRNNDVIILDGSKGILFVNPDENVRNQYQAVIMDYQKHSEELKLLKDKTAITLDGTRITLSGNISEAGEMDSMFNHGAEGVGLLRTEMLFMDRNQFPDEDEQFEFYKTIALNAKGKPVIIRTIDIGGDKSLPYFNLPAELNPFLGYRAIRICLDRPDLFITQLKAILRASVYGGLKIMFPMISNLSEILEAKKILEEAKSSLTQQNVNFNADIEVGIMIEIPSAAITADILAREVSFFSIGTNDLCQYILAVDRMNEKISHLYDPFNPGVLRLISHVIEQSQKHNIHVGMCGEMAADPLATQLLMGMGLKEFSMSATSIPAVKKIILSNNMEKAGEICSKVMQMNSSAEIISYLEQNL